MLFFFELFLFVLVMLTLALGEFVSRGLAVMLWLVVTAFAVGGYFLALGALRPLLSREAGPARAADDEPAAGAGGERPATVQPTADDRPGGAPTALDQKWALTLLYNWRRTNVLLLLGLAVVGGWYWLGG
jgi:hypothetical protein